MACSDTARKRLERLPPIAASGFVHWQEITEADNAEMFSQMRSTRVLWTRPSADDGRGATSKISIVSFAEQPSPFHRLGLAPGANYSWHSAGGYLYGRTGAAMPIFQFHIRDQQGLVLDEEGVELPDALEAAKEAIRSAQEFFEDASMPTDMAFEITDEAGRLVLILPIRNDAAGSDEADLALAS